MKKEIYMYILLLGSIFTSYSQDGKESTFTLPGGSTHIEKAWEYPGGKDKFLQDIKDNFNPPNQVWKDNLHGKILLELSIDTTGIIKGKIIKGLRPDIDSAAIEMTRKLKRVQPGTQDLKKKPIKLSLPLNI
jgi:hypothetical protein